MTTETFNTITSDKVTDQGLTVLQGVNNNTIDNDDCINVLGNTVSYTFTKIADTSDSFKSFSSYPRPSINNSGTVAFEADLRGGGNGIFIGNGGATTTIADTSGSFSNIYSDFSFNDQGTVAFAADRKKGGTGIFTSNGETTTTIAESGDYFSSVFFPSINNEGTVAFQALLKGSGEGIFMGNGETLTNMVETSDRYVRFSSPAINDSGTVAFKLLLPTSANGSGIFTDCDGSPTTIVNDSSGVVFNSSGPLTTIVDDRESFFSFGDLYQTPISMNEAGTVAFYGAFHGSDTMTGGTGIFTDDGESLTSIATNTTGSFVDFYTSSINNNGEVAFLASIPRSTSGRGYDQGIFTGPDPVADEVIAVGDTLFGSAVTSLKFYRQGLNDIGEVAFEASLADGTSGIFRADPVRAY